MNIPEDNALAFRARRHHLLGPGADTPAEVARDLVGIQAQVLAPALWSIAVRMENSPTASALEQDLHSDSQLVRTWGQRDTLHIYHAPTHWPPVVACIQEWPIGARGGVQMSDDALASAHQRIAELGRTVTRSDFFDLIPEDFLGYMASRTGPGMPAKRGAAGRFIWALARQGHLSAHTREGREQSYILRHQRFPELEWRQPHPADAGALLIRHYLRANAPATVQDIAHFLGARITDTRVLIEGLQDDLVAVDCGQRTELLVLKDDVEALNAGPPEVWSARLLPRFDTLLMSHADKSWTVPNEDDRPEIWGRAAQVYATVLHRGRLIATWKHKALKKSVKVDVTPLSGWTEDAMDGIEADAERFASHLEVPTAKVRVLDN